MPKVKTKRTAIKSKLKDAVYVGIDQSLLDTGICIVDAYGSILETKSVKSDPKHTIEARINYILDEIDYVINQYSQRKRIVYVEGLAFGARGQGMTNLAGLHHALRLMLLKDEIEYSVIAPTTVKKFVCGSGTAKKEMMMLRIYKRWGIEFDNNNIADAFGIAQYALAIANGSYKKVSNEKNKSKK